MITVHEARSLVQASIMPLGTETLPLSQLQNCVLAEDIVAPFALPRFTNAAMDGFAVKWDDICHATADEPVHLQVSQVIPAGSGSTQSVVSGCCAEIMTGAPIPDGADTVIPFEQTSGFGGNTVEIYKPVKYCANVRYAGEEVAFGDFLLRKGVTLTLAEITLLASFGFASVAVQRRPRVSLVTVGDEVRLPGEEASAVQIYNSNHFMLEALCRSVGLEPVAMRHVPDNREALRSVLAEALSECDVLITAGGISTGEYDFVQSELAELGVTKKFWSVAQKPGKPLYFGVGNEGQVVFALPGNPISAIVCLVVYGVPAMLALQRKGEIASIRACLVEPFPTDKKRYRFLPGKVWVEGGEYRCRIADKIDSHNVTSLLGANCLIEAEASDAMLPTASEAICTLLPWATMDDRWKSC